MTTDAYAKSGVDTVAGERAVDLIKEKVESTFGNYTEGKIISGIGGFSSIASMPDGRVMGTSTDGVGTKLMLAILMEKHDTVGIDLVAMCVNDLVVTGMMPAVFLDYMAAGKQVPERTERVVAGVVEGCHRSQCALIGGEMAEMPGIYDVRDYDLAGFVVGFADSEESLILGKDIAPGMKVYSIPSSGVHSNGFSLIRKVFGIDFDNAEEAKKKLDTHYDVLGRTLGEELMEPTKIYVKEVKELMAKYDIAGMVNITGGGIIENAPRILPENCRVEVKKGSWTVPPIFHLIEEEGDLSYDDMLHALNYGIGMVVITSDEIAEGELIGEVVERGEGPAINIV